MTQGTKAEKKTINAFALSPTPIQIMVMGIQDTGGIGRRISKIGRIKLSKPLNHPINSPRGQETKDDPFFTKLLEYMEHEAFRRGYHVNCAYSSLAAASGYPFPSLPYQNHSDCLIILGRFDPQHLAYVTPYFKNIVYVGLNFLDAPCDQIVCNGYKTVSYTHL